MLVQVPGFTHPVTDMYLEDILKLIGYQDALLGGSGKASQVNGHKKSQHSGKRPLISCHRQRMYAHFLKGQFCILQIIDLMCNQSCGAAGKTRIVAVPPEQRAAIERAIMDAFLTGSDDNFDRLLEVRSTPAHLHIKLQRHFDRLSSRTYRA